MQPWADVAPTHGEFETDAGLSYGLDRSANVLIQGENARALEILRPKLEGQLKCAYLDPPYNNRDRYEHYDDAVSHDRWLSSLEVRLELLKPLLRKDGSLWISVDDTGMHYLKVLADKVLGRSGFVSTIVWEHRRSRENRRVFSNNHEYLLVYARSLDEFKMARNLVDLSPEVLARYRNPDDDPRGPWQSVSATAQAGHATKAQFYELVAPSGRRHLPPKGRCWIFSEQRMNEAVERDEIWFGRDGNGVPRVKRFLGSAPKGLTPETLWTADFAGTTRDAKRHQLDLLPDVPVFETPKPESLLRRIIEIATNPGDLVLDPYLGSGTTAAVAHKLGRPWIGIEKGEQAVTHCASRLREVVLGEPGGISEAVHWSGGGGFQFLRQREAAEPIERAAA